MSALQKLVPKPKWFTSHEDMKQGDIILFNKSEGSLVGEYKYGIVEEVHRSPDGKIRSVKIKYRNANENVDRITVRAVRTLIVIHRVHEIDIMEEIGKSAIYMSSYYFVRKEFSSLSRQCSMGCI